MSERVAEYEVLGEIGHGGFGRVYKAYDPKVGREVAIKTLNDAGDAELIDRFRVEATAAGNLNHANIVTIYEFGVWQGTHYLVMEYLAGRDLRRVISEDSNLSVLEVMTIMNQVAQGLSFAHNHGVVHRDVKPANIMLLSGGMVKIMDFGIARLTSKAQPHLTKSGFILGTLMYLAPEQFAGCQYDALCDVWAFGVVYYELLTGQNPFKAGDDASIMYRITTAEPTPIRTLRADCPPELEQLIGRLLTRNREDRYQSLEDVVFDSEPILQRLRKDRAADLKKIVESLIREEKFEQAQITVRQMLELDPFNEEARRWRDKIRKLAREKELKPRVQSLLASAESEVQKRRFEAATQFLETALRLDPENTSVKNTIERVRRAQERHQRVQSLLAQAVQDLGAQNMTNALMRASEAAAADPESEAAKLLIRQIQEQTDEQDRRRKLEVGLSSADDLMHSGSYEQAVTLLRDLHRACPDDPEILKKISEITRRQAAAQLNEQLSQGISSARVLLQASKFSEAVSLLEKLRLEFPDDPTLGELHSFAVKQNDARQQEVEAQAIGRKAWALTKESEFEAGLRLIDEGLRRFPGDVILVRVRVAIRAAQTKHEEEAAVKSALELSRGLAEQGKFDEAIRGLQGALRRFPARGELQLVLGQLEEQSTRVQREREKQESAQREREKLAKARAELESGRIAEAEALVLELQKDLPEEPGVAELLVEIHERTAAQVRQAADQRFEESARALIREKQFERAIEILDEGLRSFPGDSEMERLKETAQSLAASYQRQQAIIESVAEANLRRQAGKYEEALRVVDGALKKFGSEPGLEQCRRNILFEREQNENAKALEKVKADYAALLSGDRPREAAALIENAQLRHPNEPELPRMLDLARKAAAALEDRERRRAALAALELRVREAVSRDEFELAVAELAKNRADFGKEGIWQGLWREIEHRVLKSPESLPASIAALKIAAENHAGQPELAQILKAADGALAAKEEEFIQIALNRIDKLKRIGDIRGALGEAEGLCRLHPSEIRAQAVAERLRSEMRDLTIAERRKVAAAHLQSGNPEKAIEVLQQLSREFPGIAVIGTDLDRANRELELHNLLSHAGKLLSDGNHAGAIELLKGAPKHFQDHPDVKRLMQSAKEAGKALEERTRLEQLRRQAVVEAIPAPEIRPAERPEEAFWLRHKLALIGAAVVVVLAIGAGIIFRPGVRTSEAPPKQVATTQPSQPLKQAETAPVPTDTGSAPSTAKNVETSTPPVVHPPSGKATTAPAGVQTQPVQTKPAEPVEQPKPAPTAPPVATQVETPKPAADSAAPVRPAGRFTVREDHCTWRGNLAADSLLVLGGGKVIEGGGSLACARWPTDAGEIRIVLHTDGVKIEGTPTADHNFRLSLRNKSEGALSHIEFTWTLAQ